MSVYRSINAAAIQWGLKNERRAVAEYQSKTSTVVLPTGFTIMEEHPYLGASADGIVDNSVVIEIKCPYSGRDKTVQELIQYGYDHVEYDDNNCLCLKTSSKYYCQVQGEMAIKKVNLCHFIIWTPSDMAIINVNFDPVFWSKQLLPSLLAFYANYICPHFVQKG